MRRAGRKSRPHDEVVQDPALNREIFLGLWKIHILHHAAEGPLYGQWMMKELRRHGYDISPGTMYPILRRMERNGWIRASAKRRAHARERVEYTLTAAGRRILETVREQVKELSDEVGT